jgi:acetate kinase
VPADGRVLALNCGSSSVKLALLDPQTGERAVEGLAERVGTLDVSLRLTRGGVTIAVGAPDDVTHLGVVSALVRALTDDERATVAATGHRVVHGGARFTESVRIDGDVLAGLEDVTHLAPLHTPGNIAGILAARAALPGVPDVAVFDTAFHRTLPPHAYRYAVPRSWFEEHGVRRFGFHGISHRYVSGRAAALLGRDVDDLHLVTMHLGNGCSACAVREGESVDTTMGLTPLEGLVMGTRSGDIDAGALGYVGHRTGLDLDGVVAALTNESGLLGISGLSNDMRTLVEAAESGHPDAALAVDVFCYRAAKAVCAMASGLDRIDAVVLTGGIGERAAAVRSGIMRHLAVMGVVEDPVANAEHGRSTSGRVSAEGATHVLVVPTDEELMIARDTSALVARSHNA